MSDDFIKAFWNEQAKKHGESHWASWGDHHMLDLEYEVVHKYTRDDQVVLDAGCSNGHAAHRHATARKFAELHAIDFSEEMVGLAKTKLAGLSKQCHVRVSLADARELPYPNATFDMAYCTRVLINLPTWSDQTKAIAELIRVTKSGGTVLISEAFWEPLCALNSVRMLCGLPPLVEHDFNRYLKEDRLGALLEARKIPFLVENFSSLYYLGSRLVRELVTEVGRYPGYSNPVNEDFHALERKYSGGPFGVQKAYALTVP